MSDFIKKILCKHEYKWCRKSEDYYSLNGEYHYLVCSKCGKVKDKMWVKFD